MSDSSSARTKDRLRASSSAGAFEFLFAPDRRQYVRDGWLDLLIILLSPPFLVPDAFRGARLFRGLRLLRFVRAAAVAAIGLREAAQGLRQRSFHYVALATLVVTTTTAGYGDISPATLEGRVIAVALMIVGIGFIGVFTATITSFFFDQSRSDAVQQLHDRLNRIEAKLDQLSSRSA